MNLVQRATGIVAQPRPEWGRIEHEHASVPSLYLNYALIMAAMPVVVQVLVALLTNGVGGLVTAIIAGAFSLALTLALIFVMGIIANALAPSFGGVQNPIGAHKLIVYAATPLWLVAAVSALLGVIPLLGALIGFVLLLLAFGYTAYLIYLGSPAIMRVPQQKAGVYAAALAGIWFVLYLVVAAIIGIVFVAIFGAAMIAGAASALT